MIESPVERIYLDENDIVWMKFNNKAKLSRDNVNEFHTLWEEICLGKKRSIIIDFRASFVSITCEFLEQLNSDSNAFKWRKAEAILLDSLSHRLMADFYKRLETTIIPVKIFFKEKEAIKWLEQFQ